MPSLFEINDVSGNSVSTESREIASRLFEVTDAGTWSMTFDKEAVRDIERLMKLIPRAKKPDDIVYSALQILALAVNRDVIIEGKNKGDPKRVSGLWRL